jgi:hypothetical protein
MKRPATWRFRWFSQITRQKCGWRPNDPFVDDYVQHLTSKRLTAEIDHDCHLPIHSVALGAQVSLQSQAIDQLAISKPQLSMNIAERSNNRGRCRFTKQRTVGLIPISYDQVRPGRTYHRMTEIRIKRMHLARNPFTSPLVSVPAPLVSVSHCYGLRGATRCHPARISGRPPLGQAITSY